MKFLARLVMLAVAAATLSGGVSAGAQSPAKPPASSTLPRPAPQPPVSKSCQPIYDPSPGAPFLHFNATAVCAALPSSPIGTACGCPAYVNGQRTTVKGKVIAVTSGAAPVVH